MAILFGTAFKNLMRTFNQQTTINFEIEIAIAIRSHAMLLITARLLEKTLSHSHSADWRMCSHLYTAGIAV